VLTVTPAATDAGTGTVDAAGRRTVTTAATANFEAIHDRMPMTVTADAWDAWLDPDLQDRNEIASLMKPAGQLELQIYQVSTAVNAVANNGPRLIDPLGE
jgi:putative SOS response-associated peptidase YedK